jgi:integrase
MDESVARLHGLYLARADLRPTSVRFKQQALSYFVQWFGDIPVEQVTQTMAEDYKMLLAKGRSKVSANGYLSNFKPFWGWLFRHRMIEQNPFDGMQLFRLTPVRRETFNSQELGRIVKVASRLWRVRVCLGLLGCRRAEMLNVLVRDINLSSPHPHILLSPKTASKNTWPWGLKDHTVRYIALPERMRFEGATVELHKDIVRLMEHLKDDQPYLCIEKRYFTKLIRWQKEGTQLELHVLDPTGNFQRMFRGLQKQANVNPTRRYHELRAAFISKMIREYDLSRAAEAAGHSNVQTTRHYDRYSVMSLVADMGRVAENCYKSTVP